MKRRASGPALRLNLLERLLSRIRLHWVIDARVSASLGHTRTDAFRLAVFTAAVALTRAARRPLPRPLRVRLAPDGHEVMISDGGELAVLEAIFVGGEYPSGDAPSVIFDVGANVGFASLFFSRSHPGARIVAIEADPRTYARLVHNVRRLPNVTTLNRAAAGIDGTLTLFSSPSSISSSLTRQSSMDEAVEVSGSRLETTMNEVGVDHIDLLKLDIEGAEFQVLASAPLDRVAEIAAEIHYDLVDADEQTLRELLTGFEVELRPLPYPGRWLLRARRSEGSP